MKRLLIVAACLAPLAVLACRFNVRDVGFVDLGSQPYRLYLFVGDAMPTNERESLQSISTATFYDSNVKPQLLPLGQARQGEARAFVPDDFTGEVPSAVLVSPDQKATLRLPLAKPGASVLQTAWDALEPVLDSPRRNAILEQVFERYGVVLIVEGRDAAANRRARVMADAAVLATTEMLPGLEKEIQKPPVAAVISPGDFEGERAFLWSLGIREVSDAPQGVILYGRGRMIGPVLHGERLNTESITAILGTIGLNCECGLDRKWMQGAMVPLKWDRDRKQQVAKQLGFNPESPEIRIEMSQILAKGGPGQGVHRSKIIGDTLDELLTGYRTGSLAANKSSAPIGQAEELIAVTESKFSMMTWVAIAAAAILAIGGIILLTARRRGL
ncbi:MAG: hypothetical protein H8E20_02860 [Verrucomicrobia bacterium]|nr:hypothetical protein [Verrucomicrobiota bacterium]